MSHDKNKRSRKRLPEALSFTCRDCNTVFKRSTAKIARCQCSGELQMEAGIFSLQKKSNLNGYRLSNELTERYLETAGELGWYRAFYDIQRRISNDAPAYFENTVGISAVGWKWLLPFTPEARMLCIGARLESVPLGLSSHGAEIVVADRCSDRLRSLAHAALARNASVTCVALDSLFSLPFRDELFDAIVIPDLQDMQRYFGEQGQRCISVPLFQFLRQLLSKNGTLFLAGENRFTYAGLSSDAEPSAEGSGSERRARKSSTSSNSFRGYQLRLREAGFWTQEAYGPIPHHRQARECIPLYSANGRVRICKPEMSGFLKQRIALHPQFLKAFGHSFSLIATKNESGGYSFLQEALLRITWQLRIPNLELEHLQFTDTELLVSCRSKKVPLLIRIPQLPEYAGRLSQNNAFLKKFASQDTSAYLRRCVPQWVHSSEQEGVFMSVETRNQRPQLREYEKQLDSQPFSDALLHLLLSLSSLRNGENRAVHPLLREMVDSSSSRLLDPQVRIRFKRVSDLILEDTRALGLPGIVTHANLSLENLHWDEQSEKICGVKDWHGSLERGLPGWDCISLEVAYTQHRFGCSMGEAILTLLEQRTATPLTGVWRRYAQSLSIHPMQRETLVKSFWLLKVWHALSLGLTALDYSWVRRNIISVVEHFEQS